MSYRKFALMMTTAIFTAATPLNAYAEGKSSTGPAAERNAERDRLAEQFENLGRRQDKLDEAREHYQDLLQEAIDNGDKKREGEIRTILAEAADLQNSIHSQSTDIGEVLVELEKPIQEANQQELNDISDEINQRTAEEIADEIEWEGDLQDVKEWVTWVTRWVSIGSEMQYENDRGTRLGDAALIVAEAKIKAVEEMLEDAEPGSYRHSTLTWKLNYYKSQRDGAKEYLDSMATLTAIGYGLDILLLATGAAAARLGTKIVSSAVGRAFGRKAAERTAVTLEKGLTEVGSDIIGAAAKRESGEAATNAAARESGEALANGTSDMTTAALANQGADQVLDLGLNLTDEGFEAISNAFQRHLADNGIPSPARMGDASPEWVAAWQRFVNQHFDEVVGAVDDVIPNAAEMTAEQLATRIAERDAALAGRHAFNSPAGQSIKNYWNNFWRELAQMPDEVAAYKKAMEVAGMKGVKALQQARKAASEGWLDDALSGSTFFSAAPFLLGLFGLGASEAHAEENSVGSNDAYRTDPAEQQRWAGALGNARNAQPVYNGGSPGSGGYGYGQGLQYGAADNVRYQAIHDANQRIEEVYEIDTRYGRQDNYGGIINMQTKRDAGQMSDTTSGRPNNNNAHLAGCENCDDLDERVAELEATTARDGSQPTSLQTGDNPYSDRGAYQDTALQSGQAETPNDYEGCSDYGCADLEERVAELEATTARKGNRKVSLTVSGQVNDAVAYWDDNTSAQSGGYAMPLGHENCDDATHGHPVASAASRNDLSIQHVPTGLFVQPDPSVSSDQRYEKPDNGQTQSPTGSNLSYDTPNPYDGGEN